ncbi:: hypothetical protein [Arcticibacter svalbardensis MN12-7]|uniref:PDZ domain-containing protein n=1 Tax=Arcticibacter svalbardensis MN12-7 TaxID=1150600 RepID=R9GMB8_9SPHI|nr:PDZ domain-containing protein [Arcticibacter svalbardensis]EOR92650.1 : hypothetical protein [Arcticibacter svalbardensis MN12-7]
MTNLIRLSVFALYLSLSSFKAPVKEFYVSPKGNDTAKGTKENPLKTLDRAKELANAFSGKAEVNIILNDGIYYLPNTFVLNSNNSGTAENPVIYKALNEGKAIISGGTLLNLRWKPYKNGIYTAQITGEQDISQLYINGQNQRMARFPNAIEGKNVFDTWDLDHGKTADPKNDPLDLNRIKSWKNPEGAYLHAMHQALWGDMHWLVKGKNTDGSLILEGGWQNNRPSAMHPRYRMIENVFEELDAPGEWFYNKKEKTLYYYPLAKVDLAKATVEIVRLKHLLVFNGNQKQPVKHVSFQGFVFRHASPTFMLNKEPLLRSDWTTYRGGAVFFNGAENCSIINCEFDQVGGNSIFVNNYNRKITIKSCYIHESGANGVAFVGNPDMVRSPLFRYGKQDFDKIDLTPGPKGNDYPEDCLVEDCLITKTGRYERQTAPIQISMSHKITASHCSIYDVPRAGINISEGTFGGHIIEYCDVFNTVLETGDHGSFNSWGRDRFWTPDINQTVKEVVKHPNLPKLDILDFNTIRNSRFRCDHGWDIDLDDGSTWYKIYNNVLLNGGLKLREGYDRMAYNNVIINNSLHPHVWYAESGDVFKNNIVFGAYKPAVMNKTIAENGKWGTLIDSNLFTSNIIDLEKFKANSTDAHSLVGNPNFIDAKNGDFRVKENSPALKIGFKNFQMEFGVKSKKLKAIAKTPIIPDLVFNTKVTVEKTFEWLGARVKNVETLSEQSAAGLATISGVLILKLSVHAAAEQAGFKTGDVITTYNGKTVDNYKQLIELFNNNKIISIGIMRNQEKEIINFK